MRRGGRAAAAGQVRAGAGAGRGHGGRGDGAGLFRTVLRRLRWAQTTHIECAAGETDYTAMREAAEVMGEEQGKYEADLAPTKTVAEMVRKQRKERAKVELESRKKRRGGGGGGRQPKKPTGGGGGNGGNGSAGGSGGAGGGGLSKSQKRKLRKKRALEAKLAAATTGGAVTPLTKKQKRGQRQQEARLCWMCHSPDHQKKECPRNKANGGDGTRLPKPKKP